jgi:hypothetical protein
MHREFDPGDSLGFGYGQHRCIAELLAKTELEIVFGKCFCGAAEVLAMLTSNHSNTIPEAARLDSRGSVREVEVH